MKGLAKDYLRENKNIFSYIKGKNKKRILKKIHRRLESIDPDNPYGNEIQSMVKLHKCKFHSINEENLKSLNEKFEEEIKYLKSPKKIMPWDINNNKKKNEIKNDDNILKYRKRIAFKYRFMSEKKKTIKNKNDNIKNYNKKMNKLIKISKSIPNFILNKLNSAEINKSETNPNNDESIGYSEDERENNFQITLWQFPRRRKI